MPKLPDKILNEMARRPDYETEEFAARRIFKALGRTGKSRKDAKIQMSKILVIEETATDWEAARVALRLALRVTSAALGICTEYHTLHSDTVNKALEDIRTMYPDFLGKHPIFFVRVGDNVYAAVIWRAKDLHDFKPPYHVYAYQDARPDLGIVWAEVLGFLEQFGPYDEEIWRTMLD